MGPWINERALVSRVCLSPPGLPCVSRVCSAPPHWPPLGLQRLSQGSLGPPLFSLGFWQLLFYATQLLTFILGLSPEWPLQALSGVTAPQFVPGVCWRPDFQPSLHGLVRPTEQLFLHSIPVFWKNVCAHMSTLPHPHPRLPLLWGEGGASEQLLLLPSPMATPGPCVCYGNRSSPPPLGLGGQNSLWPFSKP